MSNWPPQTHADFWTRVCESIFVKSPEWATLVKQLPDRLDFEIVKRRTIPNEVLTSVAARAQGWVGCDIVVQAKPNPYREGDFYTTPDRWAYLQVFGQFQILEGFLNLLTLQGEMLNPKNWPPDLPDQLVELAQTASYFSAFLLLCDDNRLPSFAQGVVEVEAIRDEIRGITVTLANKTLDYGQAFLRHGILGLVHRLWDKVARYATLSAENRAIKFESKRDTVMDMLGYSVLIWSILEDIRTHSTIVGATIQ